MSKAKTLSPELTQLMEVFVKEAVELTPELKGVLDEARREIIKDILQDLSEPNPPEGEELPRLLEATVDLIRHRVMIGHPPSGPDFDDPSQKDRARRLGERKAWLRRLDFDA